METAPDVEAVQIKEAAKCTLTKRVHSTTIKTMR